MPKPIVGKTFLATGVPEKSRSQSYHSKGLWAIKAKNGGKFPAGKAAAAKAPKQVTVTKTVKVRRGKNKGKQVKVQRLVPRLKRSFVNQPDGVRKQRKTARLPLLRRSLVPGRVCIVLEGKHRGRRVIVVKALQSGLVVVTGPTSINTVPMRRVSPAYLIATSVKVDFAAAKVHDALKEFIIDDKLFERERSRRLKIARAELNEEEKKARAEKKAAKKPKEGEEKKPKKVKVILKHPRTSVNFKKGKKSTKRAGVVNKLKELSETGKKRKSIQKVLDKILSKEIHKTPYLTDYLKGRFELHSGQYPHEMKF